MAQALQGPPRSDCGGGAIEDCPATREQASVSACSQQGAICRYDDNRVDVYGHASVLLAAVQAQQRQIDQLEAQVASLRNRKAVCTAPPGR